MSVLLSSELTKTKVRKEVKINHCRCAINHLLINCNYSAICGNFWLNINSVCLYSGYIDLSKRRVSPEDVIKCEEKFAKAKCVSQFPV